ncbi:hypothetical protein Tco_1310342 [Tanacetum coccineum]
MILKTKERDNAQAMMDADYELAARIHAQEQEELTIDEKSKLFVELMDKRKKHFARLRAEEQRIKPLTKAQKRNKISLVDKKKVIITETSIRSDLKLDDAEGIDCLPTASIFAELGKK